MSDETETTEATMAPAPPADVMTPDPPERQPPAPVIPPEEMTDVAKAAAGIPSSFDPTGEAFDDVDARALHAALARVASLFGYRDEHCPPYTGDLPTALVDTRLLGIIEWAKTARLP